MVRQAAGRLALYLGAKVVPNFLPAHDVAAVANGNVLGRSAWKAHRLRLPKLLRKRKKKNHVSLSTEVRPIPQTSELHLDAAHKVLVGAVRGQVVGCHPGGNFGAVGPAFRVDLGRTKQTHVEVREQQSAG